jgi:hypothetical protein
MKITMALSPPSYYLKKKDNIFKHYRGCGEKEKETLIYCCWGCKLI